MQLSVSKFIKVCKVANKIAAKKMVVCGHISFSNFIYLYFISLYNIYIYIKDMKKSLK